MLEKALKKEKKFADTLLLPKTSFSLFSKKKSTEFVHFWIEKQIYNKLLLQNKKNSFFVLHDGPIYANGKIHLGHILNHVLKDVIVRFYSLNGFYSPYILGWDVHGLPIEQQVLKEKNFLEKTNSAELRAACLQFANTQITQQKADLFSLGLLTDSEKHYATFDKSYEANQLRVFLELVKKGLLYRDYRPIHWSSSFQTALAESEIIHLEKETDSLFFAVKLTPNAILPIGTQALVFTTQPWTIPDNVCLAIDSDAVYLLLEESITGKYYLLSQNSFKNFLELLTSEKKDSFKILSTIPGKKLLELTYYSLYGNFVFPIVSAEELVKEAEGSGIVHLAPSFGPEDFKLVREKKLFFPGCSLEPNGTFNNLFLVKELVGKQINEANLWILEDLQRRGLLISSLKKKHSYPHDWRDQKPLVFRLSNQWFIKLSELKTALLKNAEQVTWIPNWNKEKISSLLQNRADWCLSRQRSWGVPLPALFKENGEAVLDLGFIEWLVDLVARRGCSGWFDGSFFALFLEQFPDLAKQKLSFSNDTMDVWFDSGSSFSAVLLAKDEKLFPADLYLEGSDQFRGWFNSSLIISTILTAKPPFKQVLAHGFVVDQQGKKLSKSLGNVMQTENLLASFKPDILRWWVASSEFTKEVRVSEERLSTAAKDYQKIRATLRFLLANLTHLKNEVFLDLVQKKELSFLNEFILFKAGELLKNSLKNFKVYRFNLICSEIIFFCSHFLSSFYFEIVKDTLYFDSLITFNRQQVTVTFCFLIKILLGLIAPFLPFLAEEFFSFLPEISVFQKKESVFLVSDFFVESTVSEKEKETFIFFEKVFFPLKELVFAELEKLRQQKKILYNHQVDLELVIKPSSSPDNIDILKKIPLAKWLLVSEVKFRDNLLAEEERHLSVLETADFFLGFWKVSSKKECLRCQKYQKEEFCKRCSYFFEFSLKKSN